MAEPRIPGPFSGDMKSTYFSVGSLFDETKPSAFNTRIMEVSFVSLRPQPFSKEAFTLDGRGFRGTSSRNRRREFGLFEYGNAGDLLSTPTALLRSFDDFFAMLDRLLK